MNRKLILISGIITLSLIAYLGYDYSKHHRIVGTMTEYMTISQDNIQKYIFNGMLYGLSAIAATVFPFYSPEFFIRMRNHLFERLMALSICTSLFLAIYIMVIHVIVATYFGIRLDAVFYPVQIIVRLTVFYISCHVWFYLFYTFSAKYILSLVFTFSVNMCFMMFVLSIPFIVNEYRDCNSILVFDIWETSVSIIGFLVLGKVLERKRDYLPKGGE